MNKRTKEEFKHRLRQTKSELDSLYQLLPDKRFMEFKRYLEQVHGKHFPEE